MSTRTVCLALVGLVLAGPVWAATTSRTVTVNCGRGGVIPMREGRDVEERSSVRRPRPPRPEIWPGPHVPPLDCPHTFTFRMEVRPEGAGTGEGAGPDGQPLLLVQPGTAYTVRLYNPLPVRAGVTLSVDGLNTLTGQPGGAARGSKWMIAPHGTVSISGWQTGRQSARRFVFTTKSDSYVKYRSDQEGRDLTGNAGVIGAAFFWNAGELERAVAHQYQPPPGAWEADGRARGSSAKRAAAPFTESSRGFDAGTGMGERMVNPVRSVAFSFDAGMYDPSGALTIYYDFRGPGDYRPRPFEQGGGAFAPEMPDRTQRPYWTR